VRSRLAGYTSAVARPWQLRCPECEDLARELRDAWRTDQQEIQARFHQTARSAGRDPGTFLHHWVMSLARMPDNEFDALQSSRYPRAARVHRRWQEHQTVSGHSGLPEMAGGAALIFDLVQRCGYGFPRGSADAGR
jgi:hypothetical protein